MLLPLREVAPKVVEEDIEIIRASQCGDSNGTLRALVLGGVLPRVGGPSVPSVARVCLPKREVGSGVSAVISSFKIAYLRLVLRNLVIA